MSGWDSANENLQINTPDGPMKVSTAVFADAVREVAKAKGYGKFKVFVGDDEIVDPNDAPVNLPADEVVLVTPYNKAG